MLWRRPLIERLISAGNERAGNSRLIEVPPLHALLHKSQLAHMEGGVGEGGVHPGQPQHRHQYVNEPREHQVPVIRRALQQPEERHKCYTPQHSRQQRSAPQQEVKPQLLTRTIQRKQMNTHTQTEKENLHMWQYTQLTHSYKGHHSAKVSDNLNKLARVLH